MTPKRNILFLPSWYPSRVSVLNGVFNRELAELISESHHVELVYLVFDRQIKNTEIIKNSVNPEFNETIVYLPGNKNPVSRQWLWYQTNIKIYRSIYPNNTKPDLVHVQVAWKMGFAAWLLKRKFRVPYVITEHFTGYLKQDASLRGWKKMASLFLLKRADAVTAVSESLRSALQDLGVKKVTTIANCIHPVFFQSELKSPPVSDENKVRFIHVSNFDIRQKQTDRIISAFHKLHDKFPETELILVVPKDKFLAFFAIHAGMDMSGITLQEPGLPRNEFARLISSCTALVSFSKYETFGLTLAESVCLGVPVIYTKCGGPEFFITSEMGVEVDPDSGESLLQAMTKFAEGLTFDKTKIAKLAADKFSRATILQQWNSLYDAVIK